MNKIDSPTQKRVKKEVGKLNLIKAAEIPGQESFDTGVKKRRVITEEIQGGGKY